MKMVVRILSLVTVISFFTSLLSAIIMAVILIGFQQEVTISMVPVIALISLVCILALYMLIVVVPALKAKKPIMPESSTHIEGPDLRTEIEYIQKK